MPTAPTASPRAALAVPLLLAQDQPAFEPGILDLAQPDEDTQTHDNVDKNVNDCLQIALIQTQVATLPAEAANPEPAEDAPDLICEGSTLVVPPATPAEAPPDDPPTTSADLGLLQWADAKADPPGQMSSVAVAAKIRHSIDLHVAGFTGHVTLRPARLAPPITQDQAPAAVPLQAPLPLEHDTPPLAEHASAPLRAFRDLLGNLANTRHEGADLCLSDTVLGKVQFGIVTDGNSVVITVTAELAATRALMQDNANDLLNALRAAGFKTAILNWGRSSGKDDPLVSDDEADSPQRQFLSADDGPLDLRL